MKKVKRVDISKTFFEKKALNKLRTEVGNPKLSL